MFVIKILNSWIKNVQLYHPLQHKLCKYWLNISGYSMPWVQLGFLVSFLLTGMKHAHPFMDWIILFAHPFLLLPWTRSFCTFILSQTDKLSAKETTPSLDWITFYSHRSSLTRLTSCQPEILVLPWTEIWSSFPRLTMQLSARDILLLPWTGSFCMLSAHPTPDWPPDVYSSQSSHPRTFKSSCFSSRP